MWMITVDVTACQKDLWRFWEFFLQQQGEENLFVMAFNLSLNSLSDSFYCVSVCMECNKLNFNDKLREWNFFLCSLFVACDRNNRIESGTRRKSLTQLEINLDHTKDNSRSSAVRDAASGGQALDRNCKSQLDVFFALKHEGFVT